MKVQFFSCINAGGSDLSVDSAISKINQLPFNKRVWQLPQGGQEAVALAKWEESGDYYEGVLLKYLTDTVAKGTINDAEYEYEKLVDGKRILEVTLLLYVPKDGVFAVTYNHAGAKYRKFVEYINIILSRELKIDAAKYEERVLCHPDIVKYLTGKEINMVSLRLPVDDKAESGVASWIRKKMVNYSGAHEIQLTIKGTARGKESKEVINSKYLEDLVKLMNGEDGEVSQIVVQARENSLNELVNLTQESIESRIDVGEIKNQEMHGEYFREMRAVYLKNKDVLKKSLKAYDS